MNTYYILGYTGEQNPTLVNLLVEENGQTHKKCHKVISTTLKTKAE